MFLSLIKPWVVDFVTRQYAAAPVLFTSVVGFLTAAFGYFIVWKKALRKDRLREQQQRKQEERQAQFKNLVAKYKLTADLKKITSLEWDTLVSQLQSRKLTAVKALTAYIAQSLEATANCNAVTEYYPKAMEMAKNLDKLTQVKGPLHGIPFCVKDDHDMEGMDSVLGFAKNCFSPKKKTSALVLTLVELGGVPFCKTNVPQTLLVYGSDNPVFGTTSSSHSQKLSPGGSSSGTGALIGAQGALFGTGSDIGGSARIPAHFNGIASLKPTANRLSIQGLSAVLPDVMGIQGTTAIMGKNAKIVTSVYKHLFTGNQQRKFDPYLAPIPWDSQVYTSKKKLRIGYFTEFPFFPPIGDTVDVVKEAVNVLQRQGHTLVPMQMPDGGRVMRCAAHFLFADGGRGLTKLWKGEQVADSVKLSKIAFQAPLWLMKFLRFLAKTNLPVVHSPNMATVLDACAFQSHQLWDNAGEQRKLTEEVVETWTKLNLDLCICPVMPFPAIDVNLPGMLPTGAVYTMVWNICNFPAGVIKFGVESGKKIKSYNHKGDAVLKQAQKGCKDSAGSPLGVQIVGLPFQEELVLRVMEELEGQALSKK